MKYALLSIGLLSIQLMQQPTAVAAPIFNISLSTPAPVNVVEGMPGTIPFTITNTTTSTTPSDDLRIRITQFTGSNHVNPTPDLVFIPGGGSDIVDEAFNARFVTVGCLDRVLAANQSCNFQVSFDTRDLSGVIDMDFGEWRADLFVVFQLGPTRFEMEDARPAAATIVVREVPEPSTLALLGSGLVGLIGFGGQRHKRRVRPIGLTERGSMGHKRVGQRSGAPRWAC